MVGTPPRSTRQHRPLRRSSHPVLSNKSNDVVLDRDTTISVGGDTLSAAAAGAVSGTRGEAEGGATTRVTLALLSRCFDWRGALVVVRPETKIGWHRAGFRPKYQRCERLVPSRNARSMSAHPTSATGRSYQGGAEDPSSHAVHVALRSPCPGCNGQGDT